MRGSRRVGAVLGWATAALLAPFGAAAAQSTELLAAIAAYEAGRPAEAERALAPLTDGPEEARARLYLGRIHHDRGAWDDAEDHLERARALEPESVEITYQLGLTYLEHIDDVSFLRKRGMANKALTTLIEALHLDPGHVDARVSLASYYLYAPGIAGGSRERAREQMDAILQLDPKRGRLFEAEVHEEDEAWDAARSAYDEALRIAPDDPRVLYLTGMFLQRREAWPEAVEHFERAARLPTTPESRPFVRAALYQVGRTGALSGEGLERALDALLAFIERYPEHEDELSAGARWRLGMVHEGLDDADAARAAYRAALEIDPDQEEAAAALRRLGG